MPVRVCATSTYNPKNKQQCSEKGAPMNKRMVIMLIACVVVFGLVFGLKGMLNFGMNQFFDNMPFPPSTVTATEARADEWALSLDAVGTVRAVNGVSVTTQVAGEVEKIHFNSGDEVKEGDLLVSLDARADSAQLKALEAAARLSELDFDRFKKLFEQGSISRSELDRRQSERDQAIATASAQRERVAQKKIRAPFSGKLGRSEERRVGKECRARRWAYLRSCEMA